MLIEMAFNFPEAWNVARGYLMIWADVVHFLSCHGCPSATSPSRYLKSRWWLEQTQSTYAGELQACARTCSKRIGKRIGKSSITPIEKLNLSCLEIQMPSIQVHKKGWWVGKLFPCGWYSPRAFGVLRWRPVWSHGAINNPTSAARLVIPNKLDLRVSPSLYLS